MLPLALDDLMFAKGCGKSWVGDQGMLEKSLIGTTITGTRGEVENLREH
jgi:hypothetical protein